MTSLKVLISSLLLVLSGCTVTRTIYVYPELPLPEPLPLPTIKAEEFFHTDGRAVMADTGVAGLPEIVICIAPDTFDKLVMRDAMRKNYALELQAIIREHNAKHPEQGE